MTNARAALRIFGLLIVEAIVVGPGLVLAFWPMFGEWTVAVAPPLAVLIGMASLLWVLPLWDRWRGGDLRGEGEGSVHKRTSAGNHWRPLDEKK